MNEPSTLDAQLAALRDAATAWQPPANVDAAIAAAINRPRLATRRIPTPGNGPRSILWPLGLAAAVGVLSFIVRSLPPGDAVSTTTPTTASHAMRHTFTPVVSADEMRNVGDAVVVPARVPRLTLAQFGLPIDPARVDDAVDAELLVRRDGALLAYRFVN